MKKHRNSHLDHGLNEDQICYLLERFADRHAFFLETLELPKELGTLDCALWGPTMGDPAILENEVVYTNRQGRSWTSRLVPRSMRKTSLVTVIAGPYEEPSLCGTARISHPCVLYTAFGGPPAPQEPGDPSCKDQVTSQAFWREHALTR